MTFHEKLQRLRRASGLSQEQLAEELRVSRQAVSKWEMGSVPDVDNVVKISRFFGCSMDYLMKPEVDEASGQAGPAPNAPRTEAGASPGHVPMAAGGIAAGLGAAGLLIIGILSSVCPAVLYDPPQGEVRTIVKTGLGAFLQLHHLTWLFALCAVCLAAGAAAVSVLWLRRRSWR